MHPRDQNDLEGGGGNKVFDRGAASGRGLPYKNCLNVEKSRGKEIYDTRKTIDPEQETRFYDPGREKT
jgi:hypothetical protein